MTPRRRVRLAALTALAIAAAAPSAAPAATTEAVALERGESAFWTGGGAAGDCGTDCWSYPVTVLEPAFRLRVGIDRPRLGDVWQAELQRPDGTVVATFSPGTELYSAEATHRPPLVGTYRVRVTARDVVDRRFRLRAALEVDNGGLPTGKVLVPPDLRPLPPWDFSFRLPVTNGTLAGPSRGVDVPTGRAACHAEEVALYEAVRCLRMSFGVSNVGLGPLDLAVGAGAPYADRPLLQRVRYADGTATTRAAGNAYFHHSHLHYHHDRAIGLQLLRVVDPTRGVLEPAGEPHRKGFAHRDELLRDWTTFAPTWTRSGFGLLPGWGDYYEWDRPGNYVDFGLNGDGLYVVRITADPDGFVLETDTADNVAYSLIRVAGATVEHLQSGTGSDPWDRCRSPLPLGPEFVDSFALDSPRPADCPA